MNNTHLECAKYFGGPAAFGLGEEELPPPPPRPSLLCLQLTSGNGELQRRGSVASTAFLSLTRPLILKLINIFPVCQSALQVMLNNWKTNLRLNLDTEVYISLFPHSASDTVTFSFQVSLSLLVVIVKLIIIAVFDCSATAVSKQQDIFNLCMLPHLAGDNATIKQIAKKILM